MNEVIRGSNVSDTWLKTIAHLRQQKKEDYNLIAEIENPTVDDGEIRKQVNALLKRINSQTVDTVANTIFPIDLIANGYPREHFYQRFLNLYPRLQKVKSNDSGTYFGRLVGWGFQSPEQPGFNQIEDVIQKLSREKRNGRGIKVMYEMSIYNPDWDHTNQMGFPCMSFISLKIRGDAVDLTAIYRNQYFIEKAYGNYLGLGRLLEFICQYTDSKVGKLTCIATHAELDKKVKKENLLSLFQIVSSVEQLEFESVMKATSK